MELWIRSQDKERLTKATDIRLGYFNNNDNVWIIEDCDELGRYKTKKRALEILDEIQNILMPKTILNFDDIVKQDDVRRFKEAFYENEPIILNKATIEHLDTYVYEMPKE